MNTTIIDSFAYTLHKSKKLLQEIDQNTYCCTEIGPYYSSVGSHIRHVLDFYLCIFSGIENDHVNLMSRNRDQRVENNIDAAISSIESVLEKFQSIALLDLNSIVMVEDDLGKGSVTLNYTLGALLAQANAHTIHHYAIIGYILNQLELEIKIPDFGYNPTTPQKKVKA